MKNDLEGEVPKADRPQSDSTTTSSQEGAQEGDDRVV